MEKPFVFKRRKEKDKIASEMNKIVILYETLVNLNHHALCESKSTMKKEKSKIERRIQKSM